MNLAAATLVAFIATLLLVSLPLASEDAPHGAYNQDDDGISRVAAGAHLVHGRLAGLDPARDTLAIVGPSVPYTAAEADAVRAFLQAGGRVLVADAQGTGVDLLDALDAGIQLAGVPIYSPVYADDPASPIVLSTGRIVGLPDEAVLHRPTAVTGGGDVFLATHEVSWLDANGDGLPGLGEERGQFAFGMVRRVGAGELLVVGTPRIFDNGGHPLQAGLLAWASDGRQLVLDEGHRRAVDPVQVGALLAGQAAWAAWLLPAALAVIVLQVVRLRIVRIAPRRRPAPSGPPMVIQELDP